MWLTSRAAIDRSVGSEQASKVCEGLELEGVAGGVAKEHGRLFAWLAHETSVRLDAEGHASRLDPLREGGPVFGLQHDTEVRHGYIEPIDRVVQGIGARRPATLQVRDDLMTEQIEIDPLRAAAPFSTSQHPRIEGARGVEVIDRKR